MKKNVLFVDCFNTIILRRKSPDDVLLDWGKEMNKLYSTVSAIDFYSLFKNGENSIARFKKLTTGEREYTINDILKNVYDSLVSYKHTANEEEFINIAIQKYIEVEKQSHYVFKRIINKLKNYKLKGYKIYIVSDFYCGKEILKEFITNLQVDYLFDDYFVSCEYQKSKRSGSLYVEVLKKLELNNKQVLMIGDNFWSDKISANKQGIKSKWLFKPYHRKSKELKNYKHSLKIPEEYLTLFNKYGKEFNYSNYAFALYVFTKQLAINLQRNKAKDVFFLSREGYFLKKLFDYYIEKNNIKITTHYLEISRNSIYSASLRPLGLENFEAITKSAVLLNAQRFLTSLNFSSNQIIEILESLNIKKSRIRFNYAKSCEFKSIINSSLFIKYYNQLRDNQQVAFKNYLNSFGVNYENGEMHIVDVGWKGTMQNMLRIFFDNNNIKVKLTGYYVGYLKKEINLNNNKIGLLYSKKLIPEWYNSKVYRYRIKDYEQFLRAPKNRTVAYNLQQPIVEYDSKIDDINFYKNIVEPLHSQIFDKFKSICKIDGEKFSYINSIALNFYYRTIKNISKLDYGFMNICQNNHYDSFGYVGYMLKTNANILKKLYFRFRDFMFLVMYYFVIHKKKIFWE